MFLRCKVSEVDACIVHGLMRVRPSLDGATGQFPQRFPATLMGTRKVVGKVWTCTFPDVYRCMKGQAYRLQVSFLKYKQALFYTHAHTAHTLSTQRATGCEAAL